MKSILAVFTLVVASLFAMPAASADTPNCVTWAEFKDVNVNGWPASRPGTKRGSVHNHFDVRPGSTTQGPDTGRYDQRDRWGNAKMCADGANVAPDWQLSVFYTFHISPSGKVFKYADRKCWVDSPNGGHPNQCWRGR